MLRRTKEYEGTFVPAWSVKRLWRLSIMLCVTVFLIGLLVAPWVDLTGLLIVGPCCALLTGRWMRTAATGVVAVGAALLLAAVTNGTSGAEGVAFISAVGFVALINTLAAVLIVCHVG